MTLDCHPLVISSSAPRPFEAFLLLGSNVPRQESLRSTADVLRRGSEDILKAQSCPIVPMQQRLDKNTPRAFRADARCWFKNHSSFPLSAQSSYDTDVVQFPYECVNDRHQSQCGNDTIPPSIARPSSTALSMKGLSA